MGIQLRCMASSSTPQHKIVLNDSLINSSSKNTHQSSIAIGCFNCCKRSSGIYCASFSALAQINRRRQKQKPLLAQKPSSHRGLKERPKYVKTDQKGTVGGAVALIVGTSIGSGILALPKKISPAGFVPSSISMIICWGFLLVEALLLVDINVSLLRKKSEKKEKENHMIDKLEVISIRTMAQETLGEWGQAIATVTYVFLGYTSMVAYCSKSGEILFHLINLPAPISSCFFTAIFTTIIMVGGARATDQVNQWLTTCMIGLLVAIEVLAAEFVGWAGLLDQHYEDWREVPATIPVMIFSLVYHDLAPVLCAYLGGDVVRIRRSVILGSLVPLLAILLWDGIALGISGLAVTDQVADPVELLKRVRWSGVPYMVECFSLLAVGTSIIGTLLGFSEFFKEQLINHLSSSSSQARVFKQPKKLNGLNKWWFDNRISSMAMALIVTPTVLVSAVAPDAFSAATDIAGGYCMTMLYGVLPPVMALAMNDGRREHADRKTAEKAKPALVVVGLLASGNEKAKRNRHRGGKCELHCPLLKHKQNIRRPRGRERRFQEGCGSDDLDYNGLPLCSQSLSQFCSYVGGSRCLCLGWWLVFTAARVLGFRCAGEVGYYLTFGNGRLEVIVRMVPLRVNSKGLGSELDGASGEGSLVENWQFIVHWEY
ncbi:hypothetical protein Nepgr_013110 [Nepenthes gracilis]|uniref:Tyrosine-specific transport protein n=1 Tax=Nepenthes gracilis TaxID=150966 RepID=A0AAD3SIK1_NEPGR|nr:hypothetical protein Nepgr_013110 [Nepenthes gracilis]